MFENITILYLTTVKYSIDDLQFFGEFSTSNTFSWVRKASKAFYLGLFCLVMVKFEAYSMSVVSKM